MDTTNLNINPTSGEKSEKTEKAEKAAGKAAQFAGAAGLGVVGTMVANAMNTDGDDSINETTDANEVTTEDVTSEELHAEPVTDFNPNDIMIETDEIVIDNAKVEIVDVSHETNHEDIAVVEPQPITGEYIMTTHADEVLITEVNPTEDLYMNVEPDMYGGPEGWEDFNHDDILSDDTFLSVNDDVNDDLDIADDILA